ncbi:MAG: hypothetical protein JWM05_3752 [Acidimicrobiales bacterium]|nr:hypothetical protein [Acidimicrobiales bacterium]
MHHHRRPLLVIIPVALALLGGCSSGSGSGSDPVRTATTARAGTTRSTRDQPRPPATIQTVRAADFTFGLPRGWKVEKPNDLNDVFVRHATVADVELAVRSSPIAGGTTAAKEYIDGQRSTLKGYTNTDEVTEAKALGFDVGDGPAMAFDWTFRAKGADGVRKPIHQRRVIVVHAGRLYDVTFQAPQADLGRSEPDLEAMLRTWTFA